MKKLLFWHEYEHSFLNRVQKYLYLLITKLFKILSIALNLKWKNKYLISICKIHFTNKSELKGKDMFFVFGY